ncbi:sensor histidine kinase [Hwangdonia lutea]|uniref:histidine kinase n=1 Tax=Hwangdonia lutea TaxID=3075823 RepID=A0AA97ELG2_9FLAO|nr:HAMP domain-containing sensor histidine kinase [Hwangdonia sp. SCSIO 19198]WOD42188.1 HAMP domain-containing sensor histidine kinase [Hwangdonia sp. SCSIO 19198]
MNEKKYKWILYLIVTTILLTIAVQYYWNYKNYLQNKQNFINQVQVGFDNALDTYYADLAEANQMTFIDIETDSLNFKNQLNRLQNDSIFRKIQEDYKGNLDKEIAGFTQINGSDSGFTFSKSENHIKQIKVIKGKKAADSLKLVKGITSIFISIQNDTLDFKKLNPIIKNEFERKQLNIDFALTHFKNDSVFSSFNTAIENPDYLKTKSKSTFLKQNESLEIAYPNATKIILKRSALSILISTILVLAVISCLLYLLKIIKNQKQLAEVKNDLISNITHEFKTPIATIGVAIESIKNFNVIDDKERTKTYLDMSDNQLSKLNIMVEKLLETATLDSDSLTLEKDSFNIADILQTIVEKHKIQTEKSIHFKTISNKIIANIDGFHFENAINNILDNAIKYGGNTINIHLSQDNTAFTVSISDDGNALTKANKDKIFEKFYRVPKGNTHDVKGFGIGLYYAKKIAEKHGGSINLHLENNQTTFKITFPND